jgi:predicted choloylglycine hydrolase
MDGLTKKIRKDESLITSDLMKGSSGIKLLDLVGTPYERGFVLGKTLRPMVIETVDRWKYRLGVQYRMDADALIKQFLDNTNFIEAIDKRGSHLIDEVKGISDGAAIDFDTIFALQCMDEQWWWFPESTKQQEVGCSAIGYYRKGETSAFLAQNMDIPNIFQGLEVLLHIKHPESQVESLVYTFAGMIALCGLNNQPLGICCNTLITLNHSVDGYPVAFIVRSVLEQPNLEGAIKFIRKIKHASGQNYMIGDDYKVVSLECSANKVSQYVPYEGAHRVYHTNHPLVNDDLNIPSPQSNGKSTTHARFDYLEGRMKDSNISVDIDKIKYILSSHEGPVCVHSSNRPGGGFTFGSLIYRLSKPPELYLATGPPCSNKYQRFTFK